MAQFQVVIKVDTGNHNPPILYEKLWYKIYDMFSSEYYNKDNLSKNIDIYYVVYYWLLVQKLTVNNILFCTNSQ